MSTTVTNRIEKRIYKDNETSRVAVSFVKISRHRSLENHIRHRKKTKRQSNSVTHVTVRSPITSQSMNNKSIDSNLNLRLSQNVWNNDNSFNLSKKKKKLHSTKSVSTINSHEITSRIDFMNRYDHGLHQKKKNRSKIYWIEKCKSCIKLLVLCLLLSGIIIGIIVAVLLTRSNKNSEIPISTCICDSLHWNPVGTIVAGNSTSGSASNQLGSIGDIFVDSNDALYIVDNTYHRVQQWLPNAISGTTVAGITGVLGLNNSLLWNPSSIYIDEQQNMYIWNTAYNRLVKWTVGAPTGITIPVPSAFIYGEDIFVDNNGYFYLCSRYNSTIMKNHLFNTTYTVVAGGNSTGYSSSQLNNPLGIHVDPVSLTIYVANTDSHTIVSWPLQASQHTILVGSNGTVGSIDSMLRNPQSVTRDIYGNLYVSDKGNNRVLFFCQNPPTKNGRNIAGINLYQPGDIALDSQMNLYVAEPSSYRVQKFSRIF